MTSINFYGNLIKMYFVIIHYVLVQLSTIINSLYDQL